MPSRTRPSINKRNREQARRERREVKTTRRSDRATEKRERSTVDGEDPDLVGIVAGPQPTPDEPTNDQNDEKK